MYHGYLDPNMSASNVSCRRTHITLLRRQSNARAMHFAPASPFSILQIGFAQIKLIYGGRKCGKRKRVSLLSRPVPASLP